MALHSKDSETDRLARDHAAATGESITIATRQAIEERLARVRTRALVEPRTDGIRAVIVRGREGPMIDDRGANTILGYHPTGLPT